MRASVKPIPHKTSDPIITYREETPEELADIDVRKADTQAKAAAKTAETARLSTFDAKPAVVEYKDALKTGDADAVISFVLGKIGDIDAITDLATAKQVMAKLATGLAYTNAMLARVAHKLIKSNGA
jgi:hypothetical protein